MDRINTVFRLVMMKAAGKTDTQITVRLLQLEILQNKVKSSPKLCHSVR